MFGKLRGNHATTIRHPHHGVGIAQRKAVISTFATRAYVDVPAPFKELADIFA